MYIDICVYTHTGEHDAAVTAAAPRPQPLLSAKAVTPAPASRAPSLIHLIHSATHCHRHCYCRCFRRRSLTPRTHTLLHTHLPPLLKTNSANPLQS